MDDSDDVSRELNRVGPVATYFKEGQHWDLGFSAWAAAHGVPVPPQLVRRFRVGMGRLIDGSFGIAVDWIDRKKIRQDFDVEQQLETVRALAAAGRNSLVVSEPNVAEAVARSFLNEHKLKLYNRTCVMDVALEELIKSAPPQDSSDEELDVDWLNHFADIAGKKSAPEMQALLGKILAGEIRQPGSFSPMAINVLANLTPKVAKKFEDLCGVSAHIGGCNYILSDVFPDFSIKGIEEIGFSYSDVLLLRQYQLLAIEQGTSFRVPVGGAKICTVGEFGYQIKALAPDHNGDLSRRDLRATPFSVIGDELCPLLQPAIPEWLDAKIAAAYQEPEWMLAKITRATLPATLFVR